jgi:RNA polymerase sigma factor (sigma-70 family)
MVEEMVVKRVETTYIEKRSTLLKYIQSRVRTIEEAEDILHDVFYQAVRNSNTIEPINNIMGWLYRIAKNKIIDWYRKKKQTPLSLHKQLDAETTLGDLLADSGINIEKDFIRSLVFEAIYKSIEQLPGKQREVFMKRELKGMSYKEIAEETGVKVNTLLAQKRYANLFLKKRLSTIRKMLKEYLER